MAVGFCVLKGFYFLFVVGGRRYLRLLASLVLYSSVALGRSLRSQINPVSLVHVDLW